MRQRQSSAVSSLANTRRTQNPIPTKSQQEEKEGPQFDLLASPKNVYIFCLAFRIVNALLVQTYFNPDEHWQALEVAHRITFGFGHLTWEWKKGIRSYLHPLLFAFLYKVLALLGLDTPWFMVKAPRLFQSLFSAFGDLYLYKLSVILFGDQVAKWALFSQLTNWFMFFCLTRTLSNSLETVLTIVSLYYWPCIRPSSSKLPLESRKWGLLIAALACAIRPTSAIIWLYVGLLELFVSRDKLRFIFLEVAPIGVLVLGLTFLIDRLMYGSWVLVPLNFLRFNFLSSGGDYYGTHKWHWYFTQGFSVMVFSFLPFSIAGIMQSKQWKLSGLIAWVLVLYSVLGHKEFRFVLPVLPIALIFSGYSLTALKTSVSGNGQRNKSADYHNKFSAKMLLAIFFLLATNIPMALYMSLVHQRGTEDVTYYLSNEVVEGKVTDILFLMPCHATPYYSTVHRNLPMRFLDCTPSEEKGIPDESDQFMMDPVGFASEFAKNWSLPSHIVLFDSEEKKLRDFLVSHSFKEIQRFFHAHFKVDRDLQASVVVYALTGS
ncbi:mannosyltransferase APTG1-like isoform X1 [Rosa rugosa]|uniref:mannosyltransferase APTG1-like isoform X1 n=2 Tax=Rosa rugosa TaxID=74645 RepID=UPI002B4113FA|nr:mannosyltransferase APTG1-like isoform X1 [Rosa rugosa]XP_061997161.1 mannosyltransferase APTG1-like isoform X1 [Rosa rugosa]XP_061997162.1 mannosyltransferase APTG1-like isoform X1 [Rosa rugosa]XP_061997163.1 mannosyltransferase APTG1-like isoform X1 [Rosa rugosa]XP_061997164.1 mannosyltransferase APTG1-like isoform X1 [Rosa rugosa]XP_061997165.1 mannosyltransferase APTG1-like isoform X1 [Rosa rugosa]XP_061997166.1 mannosyltransferase APTG1-like isoform X1 [Rosa rugosa]